MKPIIIFCLSLIITHAFSQDFIIKKNGDEVKSKVLEVTSSEIKYKMVDNPDGPLYSLPKAEIFMIKYENGMKEVFNTAESAPPVQPTYNQQYTYIAPPIENTNQKIDLVSGKYYQNGIKLSESKVYRILKEFPDEKIRKYGVEAQSLDKSSKPLIVLAIPFMSAGLAIGALSSLVVSSLDNNTNTATSGYSRAQIDEVRNIYVAGQVVGFGMAGLGTASLIAGISINSAAKRKTQLAVEQYNIAVK